MMAKLSNMLAFSVRPAMVADISCKKRDIMAPRPMKWKRKVVFGAMEAGGYVPTLLSVGRQAINK